MLRICFLSLLISVFTNCQSDDLNTINPVKNSIKVVNVTSLDKGISETSGIINFDGKIITHNDSGGESALYEIDIATGKIKRTVIIKNAYNKDWEDIAQDNQFIYICDIGNNSNTRKDQTIYKISKSDYLNNKEVIAEKIEISYAEQTNFTKTDKSTNFDAEAVVNIGDDLFLFTKNWGDLKTSVYSIPKEKGKYELKKISSFNVEGLITGADYSKSKNTIVLTGYNNFLPFIVRISNFDKDDPLKGKIEKKE